MGFRPPAWTAMALPTVGMRALRHGPPASALALQEGLSRWFSIMFFFWSMLKSHPEHLHVKPPERGVCGVVYESHFSSEVPLI